MKADLHEILSQYEIRSYGICDFRQISSFLPLQESEQIPRKPKASLSALSLIIPENIRRQTYANTLWCQIIIMLYGGC